jgi:hypothetical protein
MEKVGLAEPDTTIDKERIISFPRSFADLQRCRMGKEIRTPHDEVGEKIIGIQVGVMRGNRGRKVKFTSIHTIHNEMKLLPESISCAPEELFVTLLDDIQMEFVGDAKVKFVFFCSNRRYR